MRENSLEDGLVKPKGSSKGTKEARDAKDERLDTRKLLDVLQAVREGDFRARLPSDWPGLAGRVADTFNEIVAANARMADELQRVRQVVGKEGKTGQRLRLGLARGTWDKMEQSINGLIEDLLWPMNQVTRAISAVAQGDLRQTVQSDLYGHPLEGEFLRSATIVNTMIHRLSVFTAEVTRVAREVGIDGKLGAQAQVSDVEGVWKDLTENVNSMAENLTAQVRNIAEVTIAVADGDLSKKITVDVRGEILQLKEAINTMVDQLRSFASEVTRVAREVGTEGKLGGQAIVPGVAGTWKDLTDSVNAMCGNLTDQVRNIAEVTTAIARGDLSRKITVEVKGELLELKNTINTMVDQLNAFAAEVTRVAREVGTEGKLGGQAEVSGVAGTWKDLTDSVNSMAGNLTAQVRNIAEVATAIARGDLSKKITADVRGEILQLKETLNTMVDQLNAFAAEVTRVAREVGTEGKLGGQAEVPGVAGTWKDLTHNVNLLAANLTAQVRNIAEVTTAVARGDLSRKITVDVRGEILELKDTVNTMVDQLNAFAAEVTRVAREVGTEGLLGGQAEVPGAAGTWRSLTDNVNVMAANLTEQVRGIVRVVTAVAQGNLEQKLTVKSKGEVAALAETINNMIDTLATFADQVTSVAREVGIDGRLGGQANVPGAAGTWRDLTNNVNRLAANLTSQVRAIAEVATAVTTGDMTRSIQVDARGEVADLKDNINTMIDNLRLTTERNTEQDWLKTNLARFSSMLQGQRDLGTVGNLILRELVPLVGAHQGVIYQVQSEQEPALSLLAGYGNPRRNGYPRELEFGEGFIGQCAVDRRRILVTDPPPSTVPVDSTLLPVLPRNIVVFPVLFEEEIKAVLGLATLDTFEPAQLAFLEQLVSSIGIVLNSIEATMRTESFLVQSQELATELQSQKRELQQTNEELALKARQLADQNAEVERKNQEIENARRALEEKAAELALASRYKSDFLANMSHELRTPLNSILILGQQLGQNADGNLSPKQVEFARTIHAAGSDLLNLITDILDLSKVESGTVTLEPEEVPILALLETVERTFRLEAENRGLSFDVEADPSLAERRLVTDSKRLLQVLKNLLSNAFKFTEEGGVNLRARLVGKGWSPEHAGLRSAEEVLVFEVADTGVGIPLDKQKIIFEAFQQADASTSRRFGGTGLGLAISRELANLLGGEIGLTSAPGEGSTFALYLPLREASVRADDVVAGNGSEELAVEPALQLEEPRIRVSDDRENLKPGEPVLLIAANDAPWTGTLVDGAHREGFQVLLARTGAQARELAGQHEPAAIILDVYLPDMLGWTLLNEFKQDLATMHIPVQVIAEEEEAKVHASRGTCEMLSKSASAGQVTSALGRLLELSKPRQKRVLVISSDQRQLEIQAFLEQDDLTFARATSEEQAQARLRDQPIDCIVLDLGSGDAPGIEALGAGPLAPPVVALITGESGPGAERRLPLSGERVVRRVESFEELLNDVALLLHLPVQRMTRNQQGAIERFHREQTDLSDKTVMIVDDDVRNIFVVSSVLEQHKMRTLAATTGNEALSLLQSTPGVDLVLMDIMMPGMDGFETIRAIRKNESLRDLPILALTAKAMKGDREKCLASGASDYLAKPVDMVQLVSTLRCWLS